MNKFIVFFSLLIVCQQNTRQPKVEVTGAMKNVMWNGELESSISFDTLEKDNLYGLGPLSFLQGEILVNDGKVYVSRVISDAEMSIEVNTEVGAPFFVHAYVNNWSEVELPDSIKTINEIEEYLNQESKMFSCPFPFKLSGKVKKASIHIQNLPPGSKVSSPVEAHVGQTNYDLQDEEVQIIGFYSTEHKGIFTHHDSNIHMHLITSDEKKMGHLDDVLIDQMKLYLPSI